MIPTPEQIAKLLLLQHNDQGIYPSTVEQLCSDWSTKVTTYYPLTDDVIEECREWSIAGEPTRPQTVCRLIAAHDAVKANYAVAHGALKVANRSNRNLMLCLKAIMDHPRDWDTNPEVTKVFVKVLDTLD